MMNESKINPVMNAFSVDLEDWFCAYNLRIKVEEWSKLELRVVENTNRILKILSKNKSKATFFVLGWIAERVPSLIKEIENQGHEIATHGYSHKLLTTMKPEEFESDLKKSLNILRSIVEKPIVGYRAPSFTITKKTLWALDILKSQGIIYDSSIFPIGFHPDYGIDDSELGIHDLNGIIEVPLSVAQVLGKRIPCSGGGYFRIFPYWVTHRLMKICNQQGRPVIFYCHPWEIDAMQPRQNLPISKKIRHYYNLSKTEARLEKLLSQFKFYPIREVLNS